MDGKMVSGNAGERVLFRILQTMAWKQQTVRENEEWRVRAKAHLPIIITNAISY